MIPLLLLLAQDPATPAPATPEPAPATPTRALPSEWGGDAAAPEAAPMSAPPATSAQREWVDEVIRQNYPLIHACYKEALARDPRLAGFYSLLLQIGPTGLAEHVQIRTSTLGDPALDACVVAALQSFDYSRVDTHGAFVVGHTMSLMPADYPKFDELLHRNIADVERCWAEALARAGTQDLRGVVELRLRAAQGRVYDTRVSLNTTGDSALEACLTAALPSWRVARTLSGPYVLVFRLTPERGVTSMLRR